MMKPAAWVFAVLGSLLLLAMLAAIWTDVYLAQTGRETISHHVSVLARRWPWTVQLIVSAFSFAGGLVVGGFALHFFGWQEKP